MKTAVKKRATKQDRYRLGSHLSVAGGVSKAVEEAIRLDLRSLQIFTKNASRWEQGPIDPEEAARFRAARAAWGPHPVASHDSYLINLASPNDALRERSFHAFVDELERAELLGLEYLVAHPGAFVGSSAPEGMKRVAAELRRTLRSVKKGKTRVLLECTAGQGSTLGRSFEELAEMLERADAAGRTGVCLDTCHLFAAGYDLSSARGYRESMAALEDVIGAARVYCWHLNDSKGALGSRLDRHEHIGKGRIGADGFRRLLKDRRFEGVPKILETPKEDDMDRVNLALLYAL